MKIFVKLFKRIVVSCFILYGFNYISCNFNVIIPINIINVMIVSFLGPFGIIGLVFFKYIFM